MNKKPFPSLPAASVSLNAIHDALTSGASVEDAVKKGTGAQKAIAEPPAVAVTPASEVRVKATDKKPSSAE